MKRVYIAGKLNDDAVGYIKNLNQMIKYAEAVRQLGFAVYVPGLDFLMGAVFGYYEYHDYFDNSQPFLEVCDAMFVCPNSGDSNGTKKEIERAEELGIPIFYDINELDDWGTEKPKKRETQFWKCYNCNTEIAELEKGIK